MKIPVTILMMVMLMFVGTSFAEGGWQMPVTASAGVAVNKMVIGQDAEAADGIDALFDVPAFLAGDIQAYFSLEGEKYWQDIRGICSSCTMVWDLTIISGVAGDVAITWDASKLPAGASAKLLDISNGFALDMRSQGSYSYANAGRTVFRLEVTR